MMGVVFGGVRKEGVGSNWLSSFVLRVVYSNNNEKIISYSLV